VQCICAFVSAHYYLRLSLRHMGFQRGPLLCFPPCGIQSGSLGPGLILNIHVIQVHLNLFVILVGMTFLGLIIAFLVFRGGLHGFDIGLCGLWLVSVVGGGHPCDVSV
jgi:hypothetical protein